MLRNQPHRRSPGARRPTGQPIELAIEGGAYGGRMVARREGRVVFVQGGLVAETVRAELTAEKKNFAEARAVQIVKLSPQRANPPCPFFAENGFNRGAVPQGGALPGERGACGGCQYQHATYEAQLALKRGIVADLVHRQARLPDLEIGPAIPSPAPWRYRNRARWMIDEAGRPCYHQASSERLMAIDQCHIVQPVIERVLDVLRDDAWTLPLRTLIAEVTVRTATPWEDAPEGAHDDTELSVMLTLHVRPGAKRRDLRLFAGDLAASMPFLHGITLARALEPGAVAGSGGALWGSGFLDARFAGLRFRLAPLTFFQVNEPAAELMVDAVLAALPPLKGMDVLDVYAGAGTFTLPIARQARQVLALENDPLAIDDAVQSARLNGLGNVDVIPGDAAVELGGLPRHAAGAAVLDPPRAGLSAEVITELARIEVGRVVYVSCDPATLARDLRRFDECGYGVASIQPIDLFPQTYHIETIAVLDRR